VRLIAALLAILAAGPLSAAERGALELSLHEATRRALEHNTSLAVERGSFDQAVSAVEAARGAYDVVWDGAFTWRKNTDPVNSLFSGAPGTIARWPLGNSAFALSGKSKRRDCFPLLRTLASGP